jgi:hypothetical protein
MERIRRFLRQFTAMAVLQHLRSETQSGKPPRLTENEVELVRFVREGSFDWTAYLDVHTSESSSSPSRGASPGN